MLDLNDFFADFWIRLWDQVLDEVTVDCAHLWEDMSYRRGSLISPEMFEPFMSPFYRRVAGFLRHRGVTTVIVDTDGKVNQLIPLFLDAGVTGLYPMEVQAENDVAGGYVPHLDNYAHPEISWRDFSYYRHRLLEAWRQAS